MVGFSCFLIAATLLPFSRRAAWWIRVFDFPRAQITFFGLAIIAYLSWFAKPASPVEGFTFAVLSLCTVYQAWEMSAYTPLRKKQSLQAEINEPERRISLLIANVLMTNHNVDQYLRIIEAKDPDIIALAEPDHFWEEHLRGIEERYPYSMKCPLENTYGLLLYSRLPLTNQQIRFRVEQDIPSFTADVELRTGDSFELHCIHPRPPQVGVDTHDRDAELVLVAREVEKSPKAIIVTGDLNDVAWSHTTRLFLRISGLLDPRLGRAFCNTFNANYFLFRWPLDHLFHSRAFRYVSLERMPRTESDHFAVLVTLSYEPEVKHEQERPVSDHEDLQEAQQKVELAKEEGSPDPGTEIHSA